MFICLSSKVIPNIFALVTLLGDDDSIGGTYVLIGWEAQPPPLASWFQQPLASWFQQPLASWFQQVLGVFFFFLGGGGMVSEMISLIK